MLYPSEVWPLVHSQAAWEWGSDAGLWEQVFPTVTWRYSLLLALLFLLLLNGAGMSNNSPVGFSANRATLLSRTAPSVSQSPHCVLAPSPASLSTAVFARCIPAPAPPGNDSDAWDSYTISDRVAEVLCLLFYHLECPSPGSFPSLAQVSISETFQN